MTYNTSTFKYGQRKHDKSEIFPAYGLVATGFPGVVRVFKKYFYYDHKLKDEERGNLVFIGATNEVYT